MAALDFPDAPTVGLVYDKWTWNGTQWVLTAQPPVPWAAVTLAGSWTNVGGLVPPPRIRRIGDLVHLQMSITTTTLGNMAFLPALYIPTYTQHTVAIVNQATFGVVSILNSGGTVGIVSPSTAGRWDINAQYPVT